MAAEPRKSLRCAIYTRKSSEEGLEQAFNSLDAQWEACLSYIQSQKHEGWKLVSTRYDDGGFSGGNLERPALTMLLEDISAGKVDLVVVYKVDRLTRSLSDFARIVEAFDAKGASFVSVTQAFNTSTSMGRLTLNVLLSFAQFEREVTGERIRDKIAASKKKGMWMGGLVPLGFDWKDRKLVANPGEAELVRRIYRRYLELKCVRTLKAELDAAGVVSKARVSGAGKLSGGQPFYRGALYLILRNPIYVGEIRHRDRTYSGEHEAIVPRDLWEQVQSTLNDNATGRRRGEGVRNPSLLVGRVVDEHGHRMVPSHTLQRNRRYRYYAATSGTENAKYGSTKGGLRIPAHDLEEAVWGRLATFLASPAELLNAVGDLQGNQVQILQAASRFTKKWEALTSGDRRQWFQSVLHRVVVSLSMLTLEVNWNALRSTLGLPAPADTVPDSDDALTLHAECRFERGGRGLRFVIPGPRGDSGIRLLDRPLVKAITRGKAWYDLLVSGQVKSQEVIAKLHGTSAQQVARFLPCAWLAPDIVEAILEGRQPRGLTVTRLLGKLPLDWDEQRKVLGFEPIRTDIQPDQARV